MTARPQSFDPARLKRLRELDRWLLPEIDAAGAVARDRLGEMVAHTRLADLRISDATLDEWFCDALRRRLLVSLEDPTTAGDYALTDRGTAHMHRRILVEDLDFGSFGRLVESVGRVAIISGLIPAVVAAIVAGREELPTIIGALVVVVAVTLGLHLGATLSRPWFWPIDKRKLRKVVANLERE